LTPSPYVPYPNSKPSEEEIEPTQSNELSDINSSSNKENDVDGSTNGSSQGPRVFTTVLFPTAMTLQEDMMRYALASDPKSNSRKQGQPTSQRTPVSGPASATSSSSGPPAKKQKTQLSSKTLEQIESTIIMSTAPPLLLDTVKDVGEMKQIFDKLRDPLCNREHPAPKSRKRTVAELAADEALAAEQQRFMVIMDERLAPGSTATAAGKAIAADGDGGGTAFEARFERFKALEEIKENIRERKEREQETKAQQQQQQQLQMKAKAEQEREKQANEQITREMFAKRQEQLLRNQHQVPQQAVQPQQHQVTNMPQISGVPAQHGHPAQSNPMINNTHQLGASHATHSSPVVRNMTPQNAPSPAIGNAMARGQGMPMSMTSSSQGPGSPPRPPSSLQHGHSAATPMVPQRSQQPPSRNGTPAIANGTPRIQQVTPVLRQVTPTPRMSQASPVNHPAMSTPMMGHGMIAAHIGGQPQFTPQQQQAIMMQQAQQQQQQQQHVRQQMAMAEVARARQQYQQSQGYPQLSQQQQQLQMLAQKPQPSSEHQEFYRQNMQNLQQHAQQVQAAGNPAMMNGMIQNQLQFANQQVQNPDEQRMRLEYTAYASRFFNKLRLEATQKNGENLSPEQLNVLKQQAQNLARQAVRNSSYRQQQFLQQQQQQAAFMAAHMQRNGTMNGMGM
jgi:transcription factor SPT20